MNLKLTPVSGSCASNCRSGPQRRQDVPDGRFRRAAGQDSRYYETAAGTAPEIRLVLRHRSHIGDGNIHVLPLNNKGLSPEEWFNKIKAFHHDLFPRVYALGGKMSGEHGIGFKKLEEFEACTPEGELKMIRAIKKALDPNDIMNPASSSTSLRAPCRS